MRSVTRVLIAAALTWSVATSPRAEEKAVAASDPAVARRITPVEVEQRRAAGQKALIVDTRGSVSDEIIQGAVLVPANGIEVWAKDLAKGALIVAYCT